MTKVDISGITLEAIRSRHHTLKSAIRHTPVVAMDTPLTRGLLGKGALFLKLECFQQTGTFKARGALSVARMIPAEKKSGGITAASAGNHAIAAAWAAKACGMTATVVMQDNANPFRVAVAKAQGATVVMRAPGAETFGEAERLSKEEGFTFIHPFEGIDTSLGTAGIGLEMMEDIAALDAVVVSVGGGGLISGIAAAVKMINPACKVYGVEPTGADAMSKSLIAGEPVTIDKVDTLADSLGPPMALPFGHALCAAYVDEIVTVDDNQICAGMVVLQQEAKLAVEPAAGAAIAGVFGPLRDRLKGKRTAVVVCGANIDATTYAIQITRGAAQLDALTVT